MAGGSGKEEKNPAACQPPPRFFASIKFRKKERKGRTVAVPQLLNDIIQVLLQLAPAAALVALVLAGISLRREGGSTFLIGGGFTKWMFWAVAFVTLAPLVGWFSSFGVAATLPSGGIGTSWLASFAFDASNFVTTFVIGRLVTTLAAYFVLRAVLDAASGGHPLPSLLTAMFLLGTQATYALSTDEAVALVTQAVEEQNGCSMASEAVVDLVEKQIKLEGTFTLHSETAAKNGGDFDFDLVAVVEGDRFPRFVESRFAHQERHEKGKTKRTKKQSPWWNLALVANQAKGNQIGSITDLKTSCYAAGFRGEAYQLVDELQHALDSLKWGTQVNQELIAEIRKKVPPAPWLQLKNKERVSDMPVHLEVLPTDKIGYLYNLARKEVEDFFSAKLPIADFHGLITNEHFTREMSQECRLVSRIYAEEAGKLIKEKQDLDEALVKAEAEYQAKRNDQETRNKARTGRNAARSAVHAYKERSREEFQALRSIVRAWGEGKKQNRRGWCQSLHAVICAGKGNGSLLFHAFPQEIIDKVAEETGSNPVEVFVPDLVDGEIEFDEDGRVFLVEQFPNGDGSTHERKIFLLQISKKGEVLVDGKVIDRVQPFPMRYGSGTIRDGQLVFNDIRQRATVKRSTTALGKPCEDTRSEEPSANDTSTACAQGETPS